MEKVYLFKDDFGEYAGWTDSKDMKNFLLQQRPNYDYIKVNKDEMIKEGYVYEEKEFFFNTYSDIIVNLHEEEFFIESFEQYKQDVFYTALDDLAKHLELMKFTKKEKKVIDAYLKLMYDYKHAYEHGILDEEEYCDGDGNNVYKYNKLYRFFLSDVVGIKIGDERMKKKWKEKI